MRRPVLLNAVLAIGALALLAACGSDSADSAGNNVDAPQSLIIYSGRHERFVKPLLDQFQQQTGIQVTLHSGKAAGLLNKLAAESARTDADFFISNDASVLVQGSRKSLFKPVTDEVAAAIPAQYRAADNSWLGLSGRARVLVVDGAVDESVLLNSVWQLAAEQYKDRVAITSSSNGSFISGVTAYQQSVNDADKIVGWLSGMKQNMAGEAYAKHSAIVRDVAAGKKLVGLVNHYYVLRHLATNPESTVRIQWPDQLANEMGAAFNVAGAAITANCNNCAAAEKLMAWLVSAAGQQQFAAANSEYPLRAGVAADPALPPLEKIRVIDVPMAALGEFRDETVGLIEKVGMP